jgi:hypothetical protein
MAKRPGAFRLLFAGDKMSECIVVPTYKRTELLYGCLRRLREQDVVTRIFVFSDRGETSFDLENTCREFRAELILQSIHDHHGNSYNAGEALKFAYNAGFELVHYCEEDAFAKPDLLQWTREQHKEWGDIFCSCGWIFNHHMTLEEQVYFVPWIYIPQFSIRRAKLKLVVDHLNPFYYRDMWEYIRTHFNDNPLNAMFPNVVHYEIDGLIQRIIMVGRAQVAWNGIGKVEHMGFAGYNRGGYLPYEEFFDSTNFMERVERVEEFASDPYWRISVFGRTIVEREVGHALPPKTNRYRISLPGGWESEFESEVKPGKFMRRVNSVILPSDAVIERL